MKNRVAELIARGNALYTCPVHYELIYGAKPHELAALQKGLSFAKRIQLMPAHWDAAAATGAELRQSGFNFPALDLLIATVASIEKCPLLTRDDHFVAIRDQALPDLQLL